MMSSSSPPPEAKTFGRSQTPESPRPIHIPEPAKIPVLLNQMDPIFNDTATYNIPNNQSLSPFSEQLADQGLQNSHADDQDAVQSFFREAENQAAAAPIVTTLQSDLPILNDISGIAAEAPAISASKNDMLASRPDVASSSMPATITDYPRPLQPEDANGLGESIKSAGISQTFASDGDTVTAANQATPSTHQQNDENPAEGVDYQSLLDTIAQTSSTAPIAQGSTAPVTSVSLSQDHAVSLPTVPGLPPKPPPQEHPVEFPSYSYLGNAPGQASEHISLTNPEPKLQHDNSGVEKSGSFTAQQSAQDAILAFNEHAAALNGHAPSLTLQNQPNLAPGQTMPMENPTSADLQRSQDPSERPWTPRTQNLYDQFLENERRYVTEGIWDKFPNGSRLFVGNLPSEKVTKRDLFHKFHKHGQLAQISIKQAYGFVQFLEASSCSNALNAEQGVEIRGRKVHLEISKPQKNTRNAGNKSQANSARRRSRSPDRNRRSYSDYRDEPGRRNSDYRSRRSPSPRGPRVRDDFRPGSRDSRPRSPIYGSNYTAVSTPIYDEEAALPLARRDPRNVPDVQLLILEPEVVQSFINWVEQGFRAKGLQASTIWLNHRLPLAAVVKRQVIEGVQAVVKLTRIAQNNSKIPLQVFDRTAGASNVNFNEYIDLDLQVAADVVVQARTKERGSSQTFRPPSYPSQQTYSQQSHYNVAPAPLQFPPPLPHQYQAQSTNQPPYTYPHPPLPPPPPQNVSRPPSQVPIPQVNQPPNLQQLLANLRGSNAQHVTTGSHTVLDDHSTGGAYGQYNQGNAPPSPYGLYPGSGPASSPFTGSSQSSGQPVQNMQNIMEHLARYHQR